MPVSNAKATLNIFICILTQILFADFTQSSSDSSPSLLPWSSHAFVSQKFFHPRKPLGSRSSLPPALG